MDWLPEGHLAYFVLEVVETLDLSAIEDVYARRDARGERPYSPRMLLGVLVYGYCVGVFSSRKLAKATYEDVAFRVLAGGEHPHSTRIADFRLEHRQAVAELFTQVLKLCERAGLIKLGHVALDGTKIAANASKHKAMSYDRMKKEDERLRAEIASMFAKAEAIDREEDELYGVGKTAEDLPTELQRRQSRIERIRHAKAELEREAAQARAEQLRQNAAALEERASQSGLRAGEASRLQTRARKSREQAKKLNGDDDDGPGAAAADLPQGRIASNSDGTPKPGAQRNFTDPDSRIMFSGGSFLQAYNSQIVVDERAQVIVAAAVTNQAPDSEHLPAMLELVKRNLKRSPERLSADNGYCSQANIAACAAQGVEPYLSTGRSKHGPSDHEHSARWASLHAMQTKLSTPAGKAIYARRKVIAEPPLGQIKHARSFRRFSMRGLDKARAEWSLVCWTHNLLKLFRAGWRPAFAI